MNGLMMPVGARVLAMHEDVELTVREDLRAWYKMLGEKTLLVVGDCEDGLDKWALEEWPKDRPFALWYRTGSFTYQSPVPSESRTTVWWPHTIRPSIHDRSVAMATWAGRVMRTKEIQGLCVGYRASWSETEGTVIAMKAAVAAGMPVIDRFYEKEPG